MNDDTLQTGPPVGLAAHDYSSTEDANKPVEILTAGVMILPIGPDTDATVQGHVEMILDEARKAGHKAPPGFRFSAGQVFYKDRQVEEVRLFGGVLGSPNKDGKPTIKHWCTPARPTIEAGPNGEIRWDSDDQGRTHFSACMVADTNAPSGFSLALHFDFRGNELPQEKESGPFIPPAQLTLIAHGSNFSGDRGLHRALMLKDRPDVWPTNQHKGYKYHEDGECTYIYQPPELFPEWWYEAHDQTLQQLDRRFRDMRSELTADIIDILFHHWKEFPYPKDMGKALIALTQTCEYRNVEPEKKTLKSHWQAIRDARSIRFTGGGMDAALFEMDSFTPQLNLWGMESPPGPQVIYVFSPGYFIAKALRNNPIYIAPYMRRVWELDPLRDSYAKRIARYLRGEWRLNTQHYLRPKGVAPTRYRTWANILADSGIDTETYQAKKDPGKFIKAIDSALETLYQIEAIADCTTAIYHPEDIRRRENLPLHKKFPIWLSLRVCIDPAADNADALVDTNVHRQARLAQTKALKEAGKDKGSGKTTKKSR